MEWVFWGWLKSLLQYAFYQVIAQAFVFVFGSFLINFLDAFPPPYTVDRLLVGGFHLIFLLFAFTYGLLKVPSLTHSLFSGSAGRVRLAAPPGVAADDHARDHAAAHRLRVRRGPTPLRRAVRLDAGDEHLPAGRGGCACRLVIVALVVLNVHTQRTFRNFKPLVIRIDDVGHAAAVSYDSLTYTPQAPELKYFLVQFVTMHYSRMRATVRQQYAQSLYFLDGRLADATMEANKKSGLIERFLTSGGEEIDVRVKNVTLEDLRQPPYRATVDFEKVYLAPATRAETQARGLRRPPRLRR